MKLKIILAIILLLIAACTEEDGSTGNGSSDNSGGEAAARVTHIRDGDTIEVDIDGKEYAVRYIGINTPEIAHNDDETDQPCGADSTAANRALVEGQIVRLEKDVSETDQYGRLLRYVYVGDVFVNEQLVREGWAESAKYNPDTREFDNFRSLEQAAANAGIGCHPTGIFDDGNYER